MNPTGRLLTIALAWGLMSMGVVLFPSWIPVWAWAGVAALAWVLVDAVRVLRMRPVEVRRHLPGRFAVGEVGEVSLVVRNEGRGKVELELFDGIPQGSVTDALPWSGEVPPQREIRVVYQVSLMERGEVEFGPVQIKRKSPSGFWFRKSSRLSTEVVKVYPNYEPVIRFALLGMQHRENPMGIVRRPLAGSSREFHQLRDYRDGDPLAQIDWNASSRRQMFISRDYQEQRNQSVVFLLDTGRRMRALDGGVAQFDHVLNAVLLVAHVALGQGDQVAVKSFGGTDRWLPPVKGSHAMPVLLNHLYDYKTTSAPSDFSGAVEQLMARQRRRSLVILLTNLRGEDGMELLPAMRVLGSRHLVLLASMREGSVQDAFSEPVGSFSSALRFLAADRYVHERREVLAELGASGVLTLDVTARKFPVALANRYHDVKAGGRL